MTTDSDTDQGASPGLAGDLTANIHQRMVAILRDLPAIGKTQQNTQQNYMFRGIDNVLDALNPILAKHGVYLVPTVLEHVFEQRTVRSGNTSYATFLHVQYTFYGLAGDKVEATAWGEGTDSLDKATNKAMTGAMKYCLFQVFAISTKEVSDNDTDSDKGTGEATLPKHMGPIVKRFNELPPEYRAKATVRILHADKQPEGSDIRWDHLTSESWVRWMNEMLDTAYGAIERAQQDADAEADAKQTAPDAIDEEHPGDDAVDDEVRAGGAPPPEPAPAPEPEAEPAPPAPAPQAEPVAPSATEPAPETAPPPVDADEPAGPLGESDDDPDEVDPLADHEEFQAQVANIRNLKGRDLQQECRDLELPVGGSVPEIRDRLEDYWRVYYLTPDDEEGDEDGNAEDVPVRDERTPDPSPEPDEAPVDEPTERKHAEYAEVSMPAATRGVIEEMISGITEEKLFTAWVELRVAQSLSDDLGTWTMQDALIAMDWFEEVGIG